jgi:hypothetical protein
MCCGWVSQGIFERRKKENNHEFNRVESPSAAHLGTLGMAHAGSKPFVAFTAGVVVNVVLGFILSAYVFAYHWTNLVR